MSATEATDLTALELRDGYRSGSRSPVGANHADALVLRAARAYEIAHPLTDRRPS